MLYEPDRNSKTNKDRFITFLQYQLQVARYRKLSKSPVGKKITSILGKFEDSWNLYIYTYIYSGIFIEEPEAKRGHGLPCNRFRSRIFERKKMPTVISAFPFCFY